MYILIINYFKYSYDGLCPTVLQKFPPESGPYNNLPLKVSLI